MLKLCRVTKVKVLFLVLIYVFNFNLLNFRRHFREGSILISVKGVLFPAMFQKKNDQSFHLEATTYCSRSIVGAKHQQNI